jgi:hypothetical protein
MDEFLIIYKLEFPFQVVIVVVGFHSARTVNWKILQKNILFDCNDIAQTRVKQ